MSSGLSRDEIEVLANSRYDDHEAPSGSTFAMLVDVARTCYEQYLEEDKPNDDDPSSFVPQTMAGIPHGQALILGLIENLEGTYPDANFRGA